MVRKISRDILLLSRKAEPAIREDEAVGQDLLGLQTGSRRIIRRLR